MYENGKRVVSGQSNGVVAINLSWIKNDLVSGFDEIDSDCGTRIYPRDQSIKHWKTKLMNYVRISHENRIKKYWQIDENLTALWKKTTRRANETDRRE